MKRITAHKPRLHIGRLLGPAILGAILCSCGYQLAGGGSLPGGVKQVSILMMTNRTAESGLEAKVTNALIDEFTRRGMDVVTSPERAQALISGSIDALATETVARSGTITAVERRVVLTASFVLKDNDGKILRQVPQVTAEQAYAVADAGRTTLSDPNRLRAISNASQRLAESAYERLTESF